jgi:hypothetical protein
MRRLVTLGHSLEVALSKGVPGGDLSSATPRRTAKPARS